MSEKLAFTTLQYKGYCLRAYYLSGELETREAVVELCLNEDVVRKFYVPAYRIWNYHAHAWDIIDEYLENRPENGQEG